MKGNKVVRLMAIMVLLPMLIAHLLGQVDMLTPSWLWVTAFAGLMGLQATYTGFCPGGLIAKFSKDGKCCAEGSCSSTKSGNAETKTEAKAEKSACCGSDKPAAKSNACCDDGAAGCCGDAPVAKAVEKETKTSCCSGGSCAGGEKASFNVLVLGTGCANCKNTYNQIVKVAGTLAVSICIEKVEDIAEIAKYGVMTTPSVVVNGQVVHSGGVPSVSVIESWFIKS